MFKISLLQATSGKSDGTGSIQQGRRQQHAASSSTSSSLSSALEPRDWAEQAADVTDNLLDGSKYKSLAVYAEVKLAEALDKASKTQPDAVDDDGEVLPNSLKTAVCFQLLGELAELCGPFSKTLLALRNHLLPAVYSSYATAQASRPLQFDQMPWFSVANHLQRDNTALLAQQEAFRRELAQHQAQMVAVEQQLISFKAAMDSGEAAVAALTATNASLVAARSTAVDEATAAAEEAKRLAAEVARLKDELYEVQDELSNVKDLAAQDKDEWSANLAALKKQIITEQQEKEAAVVMAATRLTAAEGQELEQRCNEAEQKLEEAEQRLAALSTSATDQTHLTPRPDWGPDQDLADKLKSTAETVCQLQQQHLETVTALQQQITFLQALNQPEPAPKPWRLSLRTESSTYFITEGALNPICDQNHEGLTAGLSPARKPKLFAEGLGLSSTVPRFLRWGEAVEVQEVGLAQLQQQIRDVWLGRERFVAEHGSCDLQQYLHHHFTAAAAATAASATAGGDGQDSSSCNAEAPAAASAATAGYSFYHACCCHRQDSVMVDTVWQVLTGQLPENILAQQQQQVEAVVQLLIELSRAAAAAAAAGGDAVQAQRSGVESSTVGASAADVATALRFMYPLKPPEQLAEVADYILAACGINSNGGGSSRRRGAMEDSSNSSSSSDVSAEGLLHAVEAVNAAAQAVLLVLGHAAAEQAPEIQRLGASQSAYAATAAAAVELLECLLCQHLQGVLSHSKVVVQHVQDLLLSSDTAAALAVDNIPAAAAAGSDVSSTGRRDACQTSEASWQQIAAYLGQAVAHGSSSSSSSRQSGLDSSSTPEYPNSRSLLAAASHSSGRRLSSMRQRAAAADASVQDMPLLAAAASSNRPSICTPGNSNSPAADSVHDWLQRAQHLCVQQDGRHAISVEQLVQWLQRECLLQPGDCAADVAAAEQWCRTVLSGRLTATAAGRGTVQRVQEIA